MSLPLTPAQAIKVHGTGLSDFESSEILEYPQVFFTGNPERKIRSSPSASNNRGYDDERGDYQIVLHDHLAYRYEVLQTLGKGSFGQVVKCYDYKTNGLSAVKIIRNKKRFHHQALVEVKILEHLREKDSEDSTNIIHIKEFFYFRNHLCITFECLSINLYEFIKNNNFQGVSIGLIRRFAIQLLTSMRFLRRQRVVHCDLKPENILLKQANKSGIKVIDFGSSCFEDERVYTYIQSRFYRSPEVILGLPYGVSIDMWSLGCILAELYTGYPIFPGENEVEQLACIMEICGLPPRRLVEASTRKKMFFDSQGNPRLVPNSRGKKRRPGSKDLVLALKCNDPLFTGFLDGCLQWDPDERFTPEDGLQHEWILEATVPAAALRSPLTAQLHHGHSAAGGAHGGPAKKRGNKQTPQQAQLASIYGAGGSGMRHHNGGHQHAHAGHHGHALPQPFAPGLHYGHALGGGSGVAANSSLFPPIMLEHKAHSGAQPYAHGYGAYTHR